MSCLISFVWYSPGCEQRSVSENLKMVFTKYCTVNNIIGRKAVSQAKLKWHAVHVHVSVYHRYYNITSNHCKGVGVANLRYFRSMDYMNEMHISVWRKFSMLLHHILYVFYEKCIIIDNMGIFSVSIAFKFSGRTSMSIIIAFNLRNMKKWFILTGTYR